MSTSLLRRELIHMLRKEGLKCDYVFCTGDIRTASADGAGFPDAAASFLKEICSAVGCSIDRLFIVPGNHDVDRNCPGRHEAIKEVMYKRRGSYDPADGRIEAKNLRAIHEGQKGFRAFLENIYPRERVELYGNPEKPHFNIRTPDFNVVHVDSTLSYTIDQEANDLIVGTKPLLEALESADPDKPTLILTHFPFFSLLQDEKKHLNTIMKSYGVSLWLAGHEHDHQVMPIGGILSLQAGELRYEDKTNATVLIGEYNPQSRKGHVYGYTWFREGWERYPCINMYGNMRDRIEFELAIRKDEGMSGMTALSHAINKEYYDSMPEQVVESLFPKVLENNVPVCSKENIDSDNIIITAEGGMGKTTMLLFHCRQSHAPVLYVPAGLMASLGITLKEYCLLKLFDGELSRLNESLSKRYGRPALTLIIDGLNEVDGNSEREIIRQIKEMSVYEGIRFVITSRNDFTTRHAMPGYRHLSLQPLEDSAISAIFSTAQWDRIRGSGTLRRLLGNPMMATMYKEVCSVIDDFQNVEFIDWRLPIQNPSDLLYDYYIAQIALMMRRNDGNTDKIIAAYICIRHILPAVAHNMESHYQMAMSNPAFREMLQTCIPGPEAYERHIVSLKEHFRADTAPDMTLHYVQDIIVNDLHLLQRNSTFTAFPHQIYRDYLSASHIVAESETLHGIDNVWNSRELPLNITEHVRRLSGHYWEGAAENVRTAAAGREDASLMINNLVSCFPSSDVGGTADYSGLDMRGIPLIDNSIHSKKVSLAGTLLDGRTIGRRTEAVKHFRNLRFSEDNSWLAVSEGNKVLIYSMADGRKAFEHIINAGRINGLYFSGEYLLADAGNMHVFRLGKGWNYNGEIIAKSGVSIMRKLRTAYRADNRLYLYYNNREVVYSLLDCSLVSNVSKGHAWENPVAGVELKLHKRIGVSIDTDAMYAENNGFKAVAGTDGSLVVSVEGEDMWLLSRGIAVLKDAAISNDGKRAVTLSRETVGGRHKIQLWDLDEQKRISDLSCPADISRIYLSENGGWIIGETRLKTWVYEVSSGNERWFEEKFMSNQEKRIATFGDKVIRSNPEGQLYLYDLSDGETCPIEALHQAVSYICFMRDGSVASVNKKGTQVTFRRENVGEIKTITFKDTRVTGLQTVREHPFLCIAKSDGTIALYHTRTGQCLNHNVNKSNGSEIMVIHPKSSLIAYTNCRKRLGTANFYQKESMGWWYDNPYDRGRKINGDVLDISFNTSINKLVAITSGGTVLFCVDKYCIYSFSLDIIINFNVDAYDFTQSICSEDIASQLKANGALA